MSVDNKETPEVNKGGRPSYEVNDKDEGVLSTLLSIGFPHRQIALYMGKSIDTLKKHYSNLFETVLPQEDKTALVENSLWYNAVYKHNVIAQLAWLKAHKRELYSEKFERMNENETLKEDILKAIVDRLPD